MNVTSLRKSGIDHLFDLKVNRLLDAFPTKTEVFQRLEGEPPLSAPVKSLSVDDSQRDWMVEPVLQQELVARSSVELLPLEEILAQLEVVDDMEDLGAKCDCSNPMGSDMGVKGPAGHPFGDVEEGQTAQEWEGRGARRLLSSPQQDEDGKEEEEDKKKNKLHSSAVSV